MWKSSEKHFFILSPTAEDSTDPDIYAVPPDMSDMDRLEEAMKEGKEGRFFAHVAIPTQKDIEQALLERKKRELLHMYDIDSDNSDDEEKTSKRAKK